MIRDCLICGKETQREMIYLLSTSWEQDIKRKNGRDGYELVIEVMNLNVCSLHFVGGKGPTEKHPDPISAVISLENVKRKRKCPVVRPYVSPKKRKAIRYELQNTTESETKPEIHSTEAVHTVSETPEGDAVAENELPMPKTNSCAVQTCTTIKHSEAFTNEDLQDKKKLTRGLFLANVFRNSYHYTGLSRRCLYMLLQFVKKKAANLTKWKGKKKTAKLKDGHGLRSKKQRQWAKLSVYNQLLSTALVKLRRNVTLSMLSDLFGISSSTGSILFVTWVLFLSKELKTFLQFSTLNEMQGLVKPETFANDPCLRTIIDCTEFYIEKPSVLPSQRRTYSSYKSRNTFKLFISISPVLHINFVSKLYSGWFSDKEITKKCGFLEQLNPGDHIMADKGFNIQDLLAQHHVRLIAPPLMHKGNINSRSSTETRRVANKRVHVERVIRRLKAFAILRGVIPLTMKSYIDAVVTVCAALVNLKPKVIDESNENMNDST